MARLAIEKVSVDFGGIHALRDVSFEIESGSIVGLIGPNGAGKSTLLNCISGITRPTKGRVRLDNVVLSEMAASSVAGCGIGRVFQHPELVTERPVCENLLIACHRSLGEANSSSAGPGAQRQGTHEGVEEAEAGSGVDCLSEQAGRQPSVQI